MKKPKKATVLLITIILLLSIIAIYEIIALSIKKSELYDINNKNQIIEQQLENS